MEANNQIFGSNPTQNVQTSSASVEMMRHKAMKYHYKIQNLLNEKYVLQGVAVPTGYEKYLQPFQG
jgi:hypothetical protein